MFDYRNLSRLVSSETLLLFQLWTRFQQRSTHPFNLLGLGSLFDLKFHESWEILGASHTSREHNSNPTSNYLDSILNFTSNSFHIQASQFRLEYIRITSNSNSIHDCKSDSQFKFKSNLKTSYNHLKIENTTIISILKQLSMNTFPKCHKTLPTPCRRVPRSLCGLIFFWDPVMFEGMSALGLKTNISKTYI